MPEGPVEASDARWRKADHGRKGPLAFLRRKTTEQAALSGVWVSVWKDNYLLPEAPSILGLETKCLLPLPLFDALGFVMHPASYVVDGKEKQGLSWGCPAVPFAWIDRLIPRLRDGSFMYAYGINTHSDSTDDLAVLASALLPGYKWVDESDGQGPAN